jgi:hypothetical protein
MGRIVADIVLPMRIKTMLGKPVRTMGLCTFILAGGAAPVSTYAAACNPPAFADFPAERASAKPSRALRPSLTTKKSRLFRTVIREDFAEPANFAGHYRVTIWGCGTDCRDFAIADKNTGSVYTMPGESNVSGVMGNDDDRISFRPDSRLFIVAGCFNEDQACQDKPKKLFYEWTGKRLRLIQQCPLAVKQID